MKNKLLYLALSILWVSQFFSHYAFSQDTVVRVVPSSVTSPRVGEWFTVDIAIENGRNVAGYQVMLHFEYPAIKYVGIRHGDYLPADAFFAEDNFRPDAVLFAATASRHESNGSGTLATLTFEINEVKASTFRLSAGDPSKPRRGTLLSDRDINLSLPRLENAEIFRGVGASDLVIESVRAEPPVVGTGETFKLYATLKNQGTGRSAATTLRYYSSTNQIISTTDKQLLAAKRDPLPANGKIERYLTVPAPTEPGTYYYGACVDTVDNESNTSNNCYIDAVSVTVLALPPDPPDPPDLISDEGATLTLPPDLISQVAFSSDFTYFMLAAQFPEITGVADTEVIYDKCTITLDIPGVPGEPVLESDKDNPRLDDISYLMSQIDTPRQQLKQADVTGPLTRVAAKTAVTTGAAALIGAAFGGVGAVPGAIIGFIVGVTAGTIEVLWESANEKERILLATADPFFVLDPSGYNAGKEAGRPIGGVPYIFMIPKRIQDIEVHIEQKYHLKSERTANSTPLGFAYTTTLEETWNLEDNASAAPSARLMSIADYPPFELLSQEGQAHLLRHPEKLMNIGEWQMPEQTSLLSNYPNPFNPETWIPYQLATSADVTLMIYDIKGRVVRDIDLGHQRAGIYQSKSRAAYWDGRNAQGEPVASGVYFYTLTAGDFTATRKMLIRK